jgi:hypothetical protein
MRRAECRCCKRQGKQPRYGVWWFRWWSFLPHLVAGFRLRLNLCPSARLGGQAERLRSRGTCCKERRDWSWAEGSPKRAGGQSPQPILHFTFSFHCALAIYHAGVASPRIKVAEAVSLPRRNAANKRHPCTARRRRAVWRQDESGKCASGSALRGRTLKEREHASSGKACALQTYRAFLKRP